MSSDITPDDPVSVVNETVPTSSTVTIRESEKDLPPKLISIDQYRVWKVRMTLHFKSHLF